MVQSWVEEEETAFSEEYVSKREPSILSFLLASGEEVSSKQLRDDLMTMLIAGHETSAAVLTWTFYLLAQVRGGIPHPIPHTSYPIPHAPYPISYTAHPIPHTPYPIPQPHESHVLPRGLID